MDIFINTDRPVDRSIVAGINQPQREAPIGAFVAGSSYDINLYFVKNDGSYNALSGVGGTDIHVAISTISRPESGTFTLTDGTDTTSAISYGASAQVVEDALNALNSDTGLNLGTVSLVDVVKVNDTQYTITFRTFGAMTALSGSTVSLFPESTPTGSIAVTGSSTVYAQQTIELTRQPAIFQETWSTITNGFSGTIALNTTRLLQSLALEPGQPFYLEVKLDAETVAREIVGVEHSTMPASAFSGAAIALKSTEGVDILSTGETGGTKYLREDGDGTSSWQTVAGAAGDMEASTYDPTNVAGDAFDMDNMVEGTAKILTAAERTTIGTVAPHIADTANPHAVTKSQVGLGNVDNTADADKPVSTAQQTALDLKHNITSAVTVNNVMAFGAVGDGVADDTAAIQAAIDDTTNLTVYIPKGTYKITAAIVATRTGVTFIGDGKKSTIINQVTATENGIEIQPSTSGQVNSFTISRLAVSGVGKATSTKAGIYFRHSDDVAGFLSIDGRIDDVGVVGFDVGFYGYYNPLLNLYKLDCIECDTGCKLEDCDTPSIINCRFKGSNSTTLKQAIALHMVGSRSFSAQMINCEHGWCDQILVMEGGRLLWMGGNVENVYADMAIEIQPGATLEMKQVRVLSTDAASTGWLTSTAYVVGDEALEGGNSYVCVANHTSGTFATDLAADKWRYKTLIVADCSSSSQNPTIILGDNFYDIDASWQDFESRGNYAYQFNPRFQGKLEGQMISVLGQAGSSGSRTSLPQSNPFVIWPQKKWNNTTTNTESRNAERRGQLAHFLKNDIEADSYNKWEHPVLFYKHRDQTHRRGSLLNDRLMEVQQTETTDSASVTTGDFLILDHEFHKQTFTNDGEIATAQAFGSFANNANLKHIKVKLNGTSAAAIRIAVSDTWQDADFQLTVHVARVNSNTLGIQMILTVNGTLPVVEYAEVTSLGLATGAVNFDLIGVGVATGDITRTFAEVLWRKNDKED